jgi:uncharacterized SAM-binding protein YcdF (DUF218 family)
MTTFESIYRFFGWWIINIDLFLLLLMILGGGLLFIKKNSLGKRCLLISCMSLVFLGVVPSTLWIFENLENRFPKVAQIPTDAKGIILLGGSVDKMTSLGRGETAYNLTAGRFIGFVELAKKYPDLQLAFTGTPFETEIAQKDFLALGLDPARVQFEQNSKDTRDNAAKTAALLHPQPHEKWVLVTSAYHMPRSVGLFRKAGFNVIPCPMDYHAPGQYEMWFFLGLALSLEAWQASSREWLGMIINYIMGRSDDLYPGP